MATAKSTTKPSKPSSKGKKGDASLITELFRAGLYKKNQGQLTRQLTWAGVVLFAVFGAWTLYTGPLNGMSPVAESGIPLACVVVAGWAAFRAVNWPKFADFLISVEAEMDKVTWSSRSELYRATVVVIVTMFFLGALLFLYDQFWRWFFQLIRFLEINA